MKVLPAACLLSGLVASAALANGAQGDPRFYASLKKLDPDTRMDQICDYEAMRRIDADASPYHPDRAKAEVISAPKRTANAVNAIGGAFRSHGRWYALSYSCVTTPDHMKVTSFSYKIGKPIPEAEWAKYGLWR
ncbi:MAG: DUF930 domain-containing protein [Pseudomonadota bacterium]